MKRYFFPLLIVPLFWACGDDDDGSSITTIETILSTSQVEYQNANSNSWIQITADEYNALQTQLQVVDFVGADATNFSLPIDFSHGNKTTTNPDPESRLQADQYLFAFAYKSAFGSTPGIGRIKASTANTSGFFNIGSDLPIHNETINYFVLKDSNIKFSDAHFICLWTENLLTIGQKTKEFAFENGDANSTPKVNFGVPQFQGLSTPTKQW